MKTPEWVFVGTLAIGLVIRLVWIVLRIIKMSKEIKKDKEPRND